MRQTISHYELFEKIGEGGMGVVWKARDVRLGRFVALKTLSPDKLDAPGFRERLLREARTASSLNHPNIVTIYDVEAIDGGSYVIAMEFVEGRLLSDLISADGMSVPEVLRYAIQLADGIAVAHSAGIVHRDLKPGNIIVAAGGMVKILDFGVAKYFDSSNAQTVLNSSIPLVTDHGVVVGTVSYMAPEQALGMPPDSRSDIFSFGVILYEMLTGVRPFEGGNPLSTIEKIKSQAPVSVRSRQPAIPREIEEIVNKTLQKDAGKRFQTIEEAAARLRSALAALTEITPTPRNMFLHAIAPLTRMSRRAKAAAAAIVVTALFAAVFTLRHRSLSDFLEGDAQVHMVDPAAPVSTLTASQWTRQGRVYLKRLDQASSLDHALESFKRAVERDPKFAPGYAGLSDAYFYKDSATPDPQWKRLMTEASRKAVESDNDLAAAHVSRGMVLLRTGDKDQGQSELKTALKLDPHSPAASLWLAEYCISVNDTTQALQYFQSAARLDPQNWYPHLMAGEFLYKISRYPEAETELETAQKLSSDNLFVIRDLAAVYNAMNRDDDAATALQHGLEIQPSASLYTNLAVIRFYQGRYSDAAASFEKAVELNPTWYPYWGNLGDAQRWIPGHEDQANQAYRRALQLVDEKLSTGGGTVNDHCSAALYAIKSDNNKRAMDEILRIEETPQRAPATYFKTAVVYEIAGNRVKALRDLDQAIRGKYNLHDIENEPELLKLRSDRRYHELLANAGSSG